MSWPLRRLDEVAHVQGGRTPRGLASYLIDNPRADRHVPFYKVGDMNLGSTLRQARTHLSPEDLSALSLSSVAAGSLVFPKAGGAIATNKKRTVEIPGPIDLNCMAVTPGPGLDARFLRLWFETVDLTSIADGSVLPQISKRKVAELVIPSPDLNAQRWVADFLEDHLSRLDAAEAEMVRAVARLNSMWSSSLSSLRREFADSPHHAIGEIAMTSLGKMLDAKRQTGAQTLYLRNINVRWGHFDLADLRSTLLTAEDLLRFDLRSGDLMVCEGGEPGRCAVWREEREGIAFQKALHRVRVKEGVPVIPEFLGLMLTETIHSGRADRLFTGTTIKHLPQEKLRTIEVPVPDLDRQQAALAQVEEVAEARARLSHAVEAAQRRSDALRRSLLSAAFSGRLLHTASAEDQPKKEHTA